jgi:hypothetical protein
MARSNPLLMKTELRLFSFFTFIEGLVALGWLLHIPSETGGLWGYSMPRLVVALILLVGVGLIALLLVLSLRWSPGIEQAATRLDIWLEPDGRLFWVTAGLWFAFMLCVLIYMFTYLVFPPHLRGAIVWVALIALQSLALLGWRCRAVYRSASFWQPVQVLPHWSALDRSQRKVFWILAVVGLFYFAAFIFPNSMGARSLDELARKSGDENITYPYVVWMLSPASSPQQAIYHWFIYEDYHYGYTFYLLSGLVMLPVRIIYGAGFTDHVQLNLLILRQMVSVLPLIVAALLLTYLQTRLRSVWASLGLFGLLLFIPQVISYNIRFWHPDGLVTLAVVLTLFFLDKDEFRYGLNFQLAAITCGLAAGIKLWGYFFFLAVGGYLLFGILKKRVAFRCAALCGGVFVLVMGLTILLSNPYLFVPQARARFVALMADLSQTIHVTLPGIEDPGGAEFYRTGLGPSLGFLEIKYGSRWFLLFLAISLLAAGIWGRRRLTAWLVLGWMLPMATYFTFFLPYKSYHYWLPVMLPLYSSALGLVQVVTRSDWILARRKWYPMAASALMVVVVLALVVQFTANLMTAGPDWAKWLQFTLASSY